MPLSRTKPLPLTSKDRIAHARKEHLRALVDEWGGEYRHHGLKELRSRSQMFERRRRADCTPKAEPTKTARGQSRSRVKRGHGRPRGRRPSSRRAQLAPAASDAGPHEPRHSEPRLVGTIVRDFAATLDPDNPLVRLHDWNVSRRIGREVFGGESR